jgi:hypothetical protein
MKEERFESISDPVGKPIHHLLVFRIDVEDIENLFRLNISFIDTGIASTVELESSIVEVVFKGEELVIMLLTQFVVTESVLTKANTVEVVDLVSGKVLIGFVIYALIL